MLNFVHIYRTKPWYKLYVLTVALLHAPMFTCGLVLVPLEPEESNKIRGKRVELIWSISSLWSLSGLWSGYMTFSL